MDESTADIPPDITAADGKSTGDRKSIMAVAGFFSFKALIGFIILSASAKRLTLSDFGTFSQLFLYLALLGSLASAGVQNGLIREIAAAGGIQRRERTVVLGGILIWAAFSTVAIAVVLLFRDAISVVLVGNDTAGPMVVALTVAALGTGLGTLLCSALSGSGRAPVSLLIQGVGLMLGGTLCIANLLRGSGSAAVVLFALGPLVGTILSAVAARRWLDVDGTYWRDIRSAALDLLRYSGTFLVVVSALPLVLFGVRYVYREQFGGEVLALWLLANRTSDVTTQVVGLYLSQIFLPSATRAARGDERLRHIWRTLLLCMGVASTGAIVFAVGSDQIISLVLSDRYRRALPFILGYLVGDVLRVGENVALFAALAARKLIMYVAIEVGLALLVGVVILIGIFLGYSSAAFVGYVAAHAVAFILVMIFIRRIALL